MCQQRSQAGTQSQGVSCSAPMRIKKQHGGTNDNVRNRTEIERNRTEPVMCQQRSQADIESREVSCSAPAQIKERHGGTNDDVQSCASSVLKQTPNLRMLHVHRRRR
jgi:hypothetical protein